MNRTKLLKDVDEKFGPTILEHMMESTDHITFADVAGLDAAKQALEEAIVLPRLNPSVFTGLREPVQGILLFGPPGNGKTLLAKAVSTESKSTFFNISALALTSKWVDDAEKMISSSREDRILLLGAINRPYVLDDAVIRLFPKRIMIGLPNAEARMKLLQSMLVRQKNSLSAHDLRSLADRTASYSGTDLVSLAKEAAMVPIRELSKEHLVGMHASQIRPLLLTDFEKALDAVKPATNYK